MAEETPTTEPAQTPEMPEGTQEGLQLSDLRIMMQILDVVTARGAIKAEEMTTVGLLYGKLKTFVDQTTQAAPAQPATDTGDTDGDTADSGDTK